MALFQTSVLNKYLRELDESKLNKAWDIYRTHFHSLEIQENIRNSKEEQYQEGFLRDLFVNVLGYTLNPTSGFNLTTELKNIKNSKKTDGAILKGEKALAVIELKGTDTTDLSKVESQAFGYKNNQTGCKYVITSNFEKLRFYIDNAVDHEEFNLFTLSREKFNLLWLCLSAEQLLAYKPEKIKNESLTVEEEITKKLYKDYSLFRNDIFSNIQKNNPEYDKLTLFKKTQKLLDRFLFIFFAEDRLLLPPNSIREIATQWIDLRDKYDEYYSLYDRFKKYFGYMNIGRKGKYHDIFAYNGGLFAPDNILDNIIIEDDILFDHTKRLSTYDFESEVSVNILGHIFEHSLNEIEEIQAEIEEGKTTGNKVSRRKKDGVFYTPKYITKYIVENTIKTLCEEKRSELGIIESEYEKERKGRKKETIQSLKIKLDNYRKWLLDLKICDPACGSGAFLNQALEYLIAEHRYIDELENKLLGNFIPFTNIENSILEKNLYGVDINEESVDIAKLSLWLRTAEKGRKLTSLNNNIKCGNSLIEDPEVAGDKAFKWEYEFPEVFAKGGFDVVIGNPPYVQSHSLDDLSKEFIYSNYKTAEYQINTYGIFIEKSISLLKESGKYGLIIPNYWLSTKYDSTLRKLVFQNYTAIEIINLYEVFEDATVDTCILIGTNEKDLGLPKEVFVRSINKSGQSISERLKAINEQNWYYNSIEKIESTDEDISISFTPTIEINQPYQLGAFFIFKKGMQPYEKGKGDPPQTREMMNIRIYHSNKKVDNSFLELLKARNVQRYLIKENSGYIKYGKNLAAPRDIEIFTGKRILLNRILSGEKIDGVFVENQLINNSDIFNLIPIQKDLNPKVFLPIIVSKLCATYFKRKNINLTRSAYPKLNVNTLEKFPIPELNQSSSFKLSNYSDKMLQVTRDLFTITETFCHLLQSKFSIEKLSRKLQNWHELDFGEFLKELKKKKVKLSLSEESEWMQYFNEQKEKALAVQAEIDRTDQEIDNMVYELYGLTDEEIALVVENT